MRQVLIIILIISISACSGGDANEALGTIERDRVILKATANEIIVSQPVQESTKVQQGTLLVKLDDRRQVAKIARAEAELAQAAAHWEALRNGARKEEVDAAKARVNGAKAALTIAEKNYQRSRQLLKQKLTPQIDLDKALAERDSAEAVLQTTTKELLVLTNGTRQEELDQAEAVYNAAQAQLDLEKYKLSELSIEATRDGYLDSLPWNEGERIAAGSTVAVLLADASPFARVYVPEPWRAKISVGEEFTAQVDGIDTEFNSRLRWVASEPAFTPYYALNESDRSRLMYLAEFDVINGNDLPIGIPVQVQLSHD